MVYTLNEWSSCLYLGSVKRFDLTQKTNLFHFEKAFLRNRIREDTQSRMFQEVLNRFQQTKSRIEAHQFTFLFLGRKFFKMLKKCTSHLEVYDTL